MFGLMKWCACPQTKDHKIDHRLYYCGTCKSMGRLYGLKSRVMLNNDAVFLGEVLAALPCSDGTARQWSPAFRSRNCFSLPAHPDDISPAIQFAATVAVMMAQFTLTDRIMDSGHPLWKLLQWSFATPFREASNRLSRWEFPLDKLWKWSRLQGEREAGVVSNQRFETPGESLDYLAEPTAEATALFFRHGARVAGEYGARETMHALGQAFGKLLYLLDALEDYREDFRTQNFNALKAAYNLSSERLPARYRERVRAKLWRTAEEIESFLHQLPVEASRADHFAKRLKTNLSLRLDGGKAHRACRIPARKPMTFRLRSQTAVSVGKTLLDNHLRATPSVFNRLQAPLVFVSALVVGFAFPHQAGSATSYRECMDLPFNLMLLGSLFSPANGSLLPSTVTGLGSIARAGDQDEREDIGNGEPVKKEKGSSFCGGCCCDGCDCCECCSCCEC